ncbi:DUF4259 domain-containing protein [Streptomyces sp. NBC_00690]|uniref:DUF4259 domain-containing protein n=1 Tax=Streptomyces sp. NBC_00690 TaxID=2975808 RepID=UPI002E2C23B7|nr:DUF4259 domain-containing protein [Streptomyces sp. NBC_00690]
MGTWDSGPFDNDTAADFANSLDDASPEEREALVRGVLTRTVSATGYLTEAEEAVAAAALIAAPCTDGEPVDTRYGPQTLMPAYSLELRTLADEALARIAGDGAGLTSNWGDPGTGTHGGPCSTGFAQCLPRCRPRSRSSTSCSAFACLGP